MPVPDGELHRVLFVDGIWVARERLVGAHLLQRRERVVSWYMAGSENSRAWSALMAPIPAPEVVATDGGSGFAKAVRETWPRTRSRGAPSTPSRRSSATRRRGRSSRRAASSTGSRATSCVSRRCTRRSCGSSATSTGAASGPTSSRTRPLVDGRRVYTHERLRRARTSLSSLVSAGTLFTYLDPDLAKAGPLPSTNNMIEGGVNAQLRAILRNHRGLTSLKRVKAVFWWCHAHSGDARTAREKLADDADRRRHRLPLQRLLRLPVARRWEARMGRQGCLGRTPPQGPLPVLAGLMDVTVLLSDTLLSYKPQGYWAELFI